MAFQETCDLLAVCERLGVPVPVLFLNQATPAWDCPLCTALNRRETLIKEKFQQTLAGRWQAVIYRQSEPSGLKRLGELGQALYRSGIMENPYGLVADLSALSGRVPLSSSSCPACRADLRVLPPEDRRYIFGEPEEAGAAPGPGPLLTAELVEELPPESLPVLPHPRPDPGRCRSARPWTVSSPRARYFTGK